MGDNMTFVFGYQPPQEAPEDAFWFLFREYRLLLRRENENYRIPRTRDVRELAPATVRKQFLGLLEGQPCFVAELTDDVFVSQGLAFTGLRELFLRSDESVIRAAGTANQLNQWNRNHQYCGKCGGPTEDKTEERAKICTRCELTIYPRLSPAVIVAVIRDDRILLARSPRFPGKFYSVLAGFVEPGETLEECVKREILEEVGITVKNIRYFGSQPWPFPDSLMVGFTAEYADGEIQVDNTEVADADWFPADRLPEIPPRISIARRLIDWFVEGAITQ
jgi:NAD+ diphosphatase